MLPIQTVSANVFSLRVQYRNCVFPCADSSDECLFRTWHWKFISRYPHVCASKELRMSWTWIVTVSQETERFQINGLRCKSFPGGGRCLAATQIKITPQTWRKSSNNVPKISLSRRMIISTDFQPPCLKPPFYIGCIPELAPAIRTCKYVTPSTPTQIRPKSY